MALGMVEKCGVIRSVLAVLLISVSRVTGGIVVVELYPYMSVWSSVLQDLDCRNRLEYLPECGAPKSLLTCRIRRRPASIPYASALNDPVHPVLLCKHELSVDVQFRII